MEKEAFSRKKSVLCSKVWARIEEEASEMVYLKCFVEYMWNMNYGETRERQNWGYGVVDVVENWECQLDKEDSIGESKWKKNTAGDSQEEKG